MSAIAHSTAVEKLVEKLERKIAAAIAEYREPMALTDASHSRSTSRRKTKAEVERDRAWALGLCEGLYHFTDDLTPTAVWYRIEAEGPRSLRLDNTTS